MKLKSGDVFSIPTKIGFGFLQYVETDNLGVEFVRILDPISDSSEISQYEVNKFERWCIGFPIKAAVRNKIVEKIGAYELPSGFTIPKFVRTKHNVRGEFLGWHIVNRKTLKRQLKQALSIKELKLSPHGIMNDTLIIERLEENWKLDEWK